MEEAAQNFFFIGSSGNLKYLSSEGNGVNDIFKSTDFFESTFLGYVCSFEDGRVILFSDSLEKSGTTKSASCCIVSFFTIAFIGS